MKKKDGLVPLSQAPRAAGFALAVLPLLVSSASAFELNWGEVKGSFDTTLSYGTGWRLEAQDPDYLKKYPVTFSNKNDGNSHFDNNSDPISSTFKVTSDLELKYLDYGMFVRGTGFYDTVIMDQTPGRLATPNNSNCNPQVTANPMNCGFAEEIDNKAGRRLRLLDAYVYGNFTVADRALNVRLGNQVINWGEALFLQDGINSANPVSLSQLRLPGAEVKEALLPLPMLYASLQLTDQLSAEAFYQFNWDFSEPDAMGTYYSTDDALAGYGAERVLVNTASNAALEAAAKAYNSNKYGLASSTLTFKKGADVEPKNNGQFGLAFRYFADQLNNTEFGLFFMNYHGHKPVAQGRTGEANFCSTPAGASMAAACSTALAPMLNAAHYIDTTTYQLVYPEDIQMYGFSFSTAVGDLSVSGELAYRPNEMILTEYADNLVWMNTVAAPLLANYPMSVNLGQHLSGIGANQQFKLYEEVETINADVVIINNFGPTLGADGLMGVLELGVNHVASYDKNKSYASTASKLNVQRSDLPPPVAASVCPPTGATCIAEGSRDDYMDATSYGYRAVLSATFNDVFAGVVLNPVLRFAHDLKGNSHRTGNFMENRKSATLGVNGVYNNALDVGVAYNAFWGAEDSNLLHDRDNVTVTVKYSF